MEKLTELYDGISLYKVNLDETRERDKNARVMEKHKFDRLKATIERDKRLEPLPLGILKEWRGEPFIEIISGHHRTRAARMANVTEMYFMVFEEELSEDEIKAKQLAHNAISGFDDREVLLEIYNSIDDVNAKIESAIFDEDIQNAFSSVNVDEFAFDFDVQAVKILFLKHQNIKFEEALERIESDEKGYVAPMEEWDKFVESVKKVSKREDIRSIASIVSRMCDIVIDYYKNLPTEKEQQNGKEK